MYGIKDFVPPVAGKYRITSEEGKRASRRTTNGNRMSSFHHGTDWAGATPGSKPDIQNITAGKVVWVGNAGGWGKTVIVQNPDGYTVQYGHLDSIAVKVGDQVPAGGKIGVMGATGNVTGVHLDMIVTKNGQSIKRDGSVLAAAPASIARRAGSKQPVGTSAPDTPTSTPSTSATPTSTPSVPMFAGNTPDTTQPQSSGANMFGDLFGGTPTALLQGSVGLAIPETQTQNQMFSQVADMNLGGGLESIYAEAARAIANVKDSIDSRPMIQSTNPLRAELSSIFDRIEV